ncbi:SRPBCC family protein [Pseudoteredinibacter isoporae]|uniref:SRPBCC family protein n=1 Tax=Pseudoteredinibacter isoporae TaxID=570281 RepID=UPI00310A9AED
MNTNPIVVEQLFDTKLETLWAAITQQENMQQWLFAEIQSFQPSVNFETEFTVSVEGKDFVHHWKVLEVIPFTKLVYQWRYKHFPGDSSVSWLLTEEQGKTRLLFTHCGHETITGDELFSYEHGLAGWHYLIQERLKTFLQSKI